MDGDDDDDGFVPSGVAIGGRITASETTDFGSSCIDNEAQLRTPKGPTQHSTVDWRHDSPHSQPSTLMPEAAAEPTLPRKAEHSHQHVLGLHPSRQHVVLPRKEAMACFLPIEANTGSFFGSLAIL
eukprot:284637-Rhodomonas_salina.4